MKTQQNEKSKMRISVYGDVADALLEFHQSSKNKSISMTLETILKDYFENALGVRNNDKPNFNNQR